MVNAMTQNEYKAIIARLDALDQKLEKHCEDSPPIQIRLAVLESEMRFIKWAAGGLGLAFIVLLAETAYRLLFFTG